MHVSLPPPAPPRRGWERFLLGECAVFHALGALLLAMIGSWGWGLAFAIGGVAAGLLLWRVTTATQLIAWYVILPLGGSWGAALVAGLLDAPTALGALAWLAAYVPWAAAAVSLALGER